MGTFRKFNPLMVTVGWHNVELQTHEITANAMLKQLDEWSEKVIRQERAKNWCNGLMVRGRWSVTMNAYESNHLQFYFKDPKDALMFKLAWGGEPC